MYQNSKSGLKKFVVLYRVIKKTNFSPVANRCRGYPHIVNDHLYNLTLYASVESVQTSIIFLTPSKINKKLL